MEQENEKKNVTTEQQITEMITNVANDVQNMTQNIQNAEIEKLIQMKTVIIVLKTFDYVVDHVEIKNLN
jgi:hypothetical protein